jgi:hypothetical protein
MSHLLAAAWNFDLPPKIMRHLERVALLAFREPRGSLRILYSKTSKLELQVRALHPIHIPFISNSFPIHIPFISNSYLIHIPIISHSHPSHIQFISHSCNAASLLFTNNRPAKWSNRSIAASLSYTTWS